MAWALASPKTDEREVLASLPASDPELLARIGQRVLVLATAIWHNRATGQPITRSLIAFDH
jgi:hypothetical protein